MALHSDKTLKTAIQKFGNLQGSYLWRNLVIAKPYSAVRSNPTYDSEASDFMKLYFETSDSESSRTVSMDLFCENSQRVKAVGYFCTRAPSWMFDKVLNVNLPNNLL